MTARYLRITLLGPGTLSAFSVTTQDSNRVNLLLLLLLLLNFSKFELIIHDHVLHYAKLKLVEHGFTESKSTVINLVTFLEFRNPVILGQSQARTVSFDISYAFDFLPHYML
jgi:hypothetical protein